MERNYAMDWLRIGAFGLLILYHVGMVFAPWDFHVKTAHPAAWIEVPMLLTNSWRLGLLFLVSGYASRAMLARSPGVGRFLGQRTARLMLPLLFGMAVIVPPQSWVQLVTQHGYANGFGWFYLHDYFAARPIAGVMLPTWNHLWFLVYLWDYTLLLGLLLVLPWPKGLQQSFDRLFGGAGVVWIPLAWLLLFQVLVFRRGEELHDLIHDGVAHIAYLSFFLFGFGLGGSPAARAALARRWRGLAVAALASYAVLGGIVGAYTTEADWPRALGWTFRVAREIQTWTSMAALIGLAERFWNHDHRWRPMLAEAVFPAYIIHQTVIVVGEYALRPLALPAPAEFAILVAATAAGCAVFYLLGREIAPLRPLIGLKLRVAERAPAAKSLFGNAPSGA